jgi:RNA polymerase sigma-70 factor (ECF subfamily)
MSRTEPEERAPELSALLERAVSGDSAAFGQIVVRTERRVLTLSLRLLGSIEDAQDAAQEVFLRAFRYLHRVDVRKPIEPWLVGITVNVCRDLGRKTRQRSLMLTALERAPERSGDPEQHAGLAFEQQKQMLHRVLQSLPERERTALVLRDLEGLSTADVAAILGSAEATIRVQISNARLKIKKAFESLKGGRP